jgi:16S rRNA (guanine(527)-N(7))-methyltransferase RsmG
LNVFRELLLERVSSFCQLSDAQVSRLEQHYNLMIRWNKKINLTRIEGLEESIDRHYAESLFLGSLLPVGPLRIADIGSGAGFPGFPVAVLRPECAVTLIESHARKSVFLKEASRDLSNIRVLSRRAEDVGEPFDWVISRAVSWASLEPVAHRLAPHVAVLCASPPPGSHQFYRLPFVSRETSGVVIV